MTAIAPWRLNLLRCGYLLLVVGLALVIWPQILWPPAHTELGRGEVRAMLGALSILAVLGLFRPLQMLPLLFFELGWKLIWLTTIAWPAWRTQSLDPSTTATVFECSLLVLLLPVIPWDHVWRAYGRAPAEPWRSSD